MEISEDYLDSRNTLGEPSGSTPVRKNETPIPNTTKEEDLNATYIMLQKRISDNAKFNSNVIIEFNSKNLEHHFPKGHYVSNFKFTEMNTDVLESINHLSLLAGTIRPGLMDSYDVIDRVCSEQSPELKKFPNMMTFQRHHQVRHFIKENPEEINEKLIEIDEYNVPLYNIIRDGMIVPNAESIDIKMKLEPFDKNSFGKLTISYDLYDVDNKLLEETSLAIGQLQKDNREKMTKTKKD